MQKRFAAVAVPFMLVAGVQPKGERALDVVAAGPAAPRHQVIASTRGAATSKVAAR